jgi:hypothetical protein
MTLDNEQIIRQAYKIAEHKDLEVSLPDIEAQLARTGWATEGPLGSSTSLLARDPDGTLLKFVKNTPGS